MYMTLQLVCTLSSIISLAPDLAPVHGSIPTGEMSGEAQRLRDLPAAPNPTAAPGSEDIWPSVHCTVSQLFLKL